MDIYQQNLFNKGHCSLSSNNGEEKIEINDSISLYQNENYKIDGYILKISNNYIEQINAKQKLYKSNNDGQIIIPILFDDNNFDLKIKFKNNLADNAIVNVILHPTNKAAYDSKVANEIKENLIKNLKLKTIVGLNAINVMWHKASSDVVKTKVSVFCLVDNEQYLVETFDISGEYLKIDSLGFGKYSINIQQLNLSNEVLVEASCFVTVEDIVNELSKRFHDAVII